MREIMTAGRTLLRIAAAALTKVAGSGVLFMVVVLVLVLWVADVQPLRVAGLFMGPKGTIYVSSPAVYTRERLVNDRNDQDFWLRSRLDELDRHDVAYSSVVERRRSVEVQPDIATGVAQFEAGAGATNELSGSADPAVPAGTRTRADRQGPALSFMDGFSVKSAWRDRIRHAILENLLDDRHDLTGNSVYGLKFDTTLYPGWYTSQRALVRISISTDQAEFSSLVSGGDEEFSDLSPLVQSFYKATYSDVLNDRRHPNYLSHTLYKRWLANVEWRLNSHFGQVYGTKCDCTGSLCRPTPQDWDREVARTVDTVLAISQAKVKRETAAPLARVHLPKPWDDFLMINMSGRPDRGCGDRPRLSVSEVVETVHLFKEKDFSDPNYGLIESVDDEDGAYFHVARAKVPVQEEAVIKASGLSVRPNEEGATSSAAPSNQATIHWEPEYKRAHYKGYSTIARFLKKDGKILRSSYGGADIRYFTIPSGYFNFIDKVIRSDSYVYSLFPSSEADAVLNLMSGSGGFTYGSKAGARLTARESVSQEHGALERTSVGFTDARRGEAGSDQRNKAIDFGWVMEVGPRGEAVQKSQFALISVPAWVSQLTITVRTGWLDSSSREITSEPYKYVVPIPPDYEAFDAFVGGEEAVRRPQINSELMDAVEVIACRPASILIPGLRLWRSAMVTLGSERADRITVLPNMEGIIAEFTRLSESAKRGSAVLRVWTSEGVDVVTGKVTIRVPDDMAECANHPLNAT